MTFSPLTIAFVGLPGSGKSTVGRQLARHLDIRFFDSDAVIENRLGFSIREFFEREGEDAFRDLEQSVICELTQQDTCILSTGGGVVVREANRDRLRLRCHTVYLHSEPEEVFRRLRNDRHRPLLQVADPLSRLKELYLVRDPLYRSASHIVVETGRPVVSALVTTILTRLRAAGALPAP